MVEKDPVEYLKSHYLTRHLSPSWEDVLAGKYFLERSDINFTERIFKYGDEWVRGTMKVGGDCHYYTLNNMGILFSLFLNPLTYFQPFYYDKFVERCKAGFTLHDTSSDVSYSLVMGKIHRCIEVDSCRVTKELTLKETGDFLCRWCTYPDGFEWKD